MFLFVQLVVGFRFRFLCCLLVLLALLFWRSSVPWKTNKALAGFRLSPVLLASFGCCCCCWNQNNAVGLGFCCPLAMSFEIYEQSCWSLRTPLARRYIYSLTLTLTQFHSHYRTYTITVTCTHLSDNDEFCTTQFPKWSPPSLSFPGFPSLWVTAVVRWLVENSVGTILLRQ